MAAADEAASVLAQVFWDAVWFWKIFACSPVYPMYSQVESQVCWQAAQQPPGVPSAKILCSLLDV